MADFKAIGAAIHENISVSTAITILQVTAPSTAALEILEAWVDFATTTSGSQRVQFLRKTATATGLTSVTPVAYSAATVSATAGRTATGEGTDGAVLVSRIPNVINGWYYLPTPDNQIIVPPSGIIAIKFPTAPGSAMNVTAGIVWGEKG
jgi:hypothetical protein